MGHLTNKCNIWVNSSRPHIAMSLEWWWMMVKGIIPKRLYYMWVKKRILYMSSRWVITLPQSYLAVPRKIRRILYRIDLFSQAFTGNSRFCFAPSSTCKETIQEIPLVFFGFLMKMAKSQDHGSVCIFCCVYPLRTGCLSSTRIGCVSNPGLSSKLAYNEWERIRLANLV